MINNGEEHILDESFEEIYNYFLIEKKISNIYDFKVFEYKALYDDLIDVSDNKALYHYIYHGIKEKRYNSFYALFKKNLNLDELIPFFQNNTQSPGKIKLLNYASKKIGLKISEYKSLYEDTIDLSDQEAKIHYFQFGISEKRFRSYNQIKNKLDNSLNLNLDELIPFFQNNIQSPSKIKLLNYASKKIGLKISEYKSLYEDIINLSDQEAKFHYFQFGISEKRFRSYNQIKNKLDNSLNLNLHQILFDKTSNFMRDKKSKKDFLNLYFHLVDEKTQYLAKKDMNNFKKKSIFEIFHLFINDESFSPYPIHYFLQMFYDITFLGKSNIEHNLCFNENLIKTFLKGKNLKLIENNYNKIYILVIFTKVFSVHDSFFSYLIEDSQNLIDYHKVLVDFICEVFKLKVGENLENLLSQYLLLIELYLIKFVPYYSAEIIFDKENICKIRKNAIESCLSLVKFNIIFLNYPNMSFSDILDGLIKLKSLNLEYRNINNET